MEISIKKKNIFEKIIVAALSVTIILLPLLIVPVAGVGFFHAKFGLVTLAVLVGLVTLIIQVLHERKVETFGVFVKIVLFGVPLMYIVSSLFAVHSGHSLIGNGADLDTAFAVFLGSLIAYLVSRVFRSKQNTLAISLSIIAVSILIFIFHILRFFLGADFLSMGIFSNIAVNTVGSFNELGIYAGFIAVLSLLGIELLTPQKYLKIGLYISMVLALLVVGVSNFNILSSVFGLAIPVSLSCVVGLFALVIFIHKKLVHPKALLPKASLVALIIALVLTIGANPISNFVAPKIGLTAEQTLDVRVSPKATVGLAWNTYSEGVMPALFGTGPNKFYTAWAKYKPASGPDSVNNTAFWNVDFNLASGYVPTGFVSAGILGTLAWILFLGMIVYYIAKLLRGVAVLEKDPVAVYTAWIVSAGTLYLWIMAIFFTVGPVLLFMAFIFTGLLYGALVRENLISTKVIAWDVTTYWKGFAVTFTMVLGIAACIYLGFMWQQRLMASLYLQNASEILQKDNKAITNAQVEILKAINAYFDTNILRLASDISLVRPSALISEKGADINPNALTQDVASDINFAISTARRAAIDKGLSVDYRDWLQLGKAYETATFLGATTTAQLAVEAYGQAARLNPTSPIPPFLIGRIYAIARSYSVAVEQLQRAITLKPDYTEAVTLLNSLKGAAGVNGGANSGLNGNSANSGANGSNTNSSTGSKSSTSTTTSTKK